LPKRADSRVAVAWHGCASMLRLMKAWKQGAHPHVSAREAYPRRLKHNTVAEGEIADGPSHQLTETLQRGRDVGVVQHSRLPESKYIEDRRGGRGLVGNMR
jgi:hypothetical protein